MAVATGRCRTRGAVDRLPSGAYRVRVYAGSDPVTGKRHDLTELVPAGPKAAAEAEKVRTRLLSQVDERRNPRTKATVNQLLDRYVQVLDVEEATRATYLGTSTTGAAPSSAPCRSAGSTGRFSTRSTPSCGGAGTAVLGDSG